MVDRWFWYANGRIPDVARSGDSHHGVMKTIWRNRNDEREAAKDELFAPTPTGSRWQRLKTTLPLAAFVYLTSTIVVMASERVYWYWAGFGVDSMLFLGGFYLIPTMAGLWALALGRARRIHHMILAGSIFAFVVEGVLTPIIYMDGPLPLMAAMFIGWHGLVAFVGFWYLIRRWLLDRRAGLLALASLLFGAFWGVWAVSSALGDPLGAEDIAEMGFEPVMLDPAGFAGYALMVGALLAMSHWLIGFVWPVGWKPGRLSTRLLFVVSGLYMAVAVLLVIPWAPLKLAVMIGGTWKLMRRSNTGSSTNHLEPTILDRLAGRVRLRDASILMLIPIAAATSYAGAWQARESASVMEATYWGLVATQIIVGGAAFIWAWRQARRQDVPTAVAAPALDRLQSTLQDPRCSKRSRKSAP